MDPYDSPIKVPYSSPNNPFPHSLLRTSQYWARATGEQPPELAMPLLAKRIGFPPSGRQVYLMLVQELRILET